MMSARTNLLTPPLFPISSPSLFHLAGIRRFEEGFGHADVRRFSIVVVLLLSSDRKASIVSRQSIFHLLGFDTVHGSRISYNDCQEASQCDEAQSIRCTEVDDKLSRGLENSEVEVEEDFEERYVGRKKEDESNWKVSWSVLQRLASPSGCKCLQKVGIYAVQCFVFTCGLD